MAAALLLLLGPQAVAAPAPATAIRCLPDQAGFLTMRLRGSIEAEVSLARAGSRMHGHGAP